MAIFFAVLGVALIVSVWAVFLLLRGIDRAWEYHSIEVMDILRYEVAVIWTAISRDRGVRAKDAEEFGLGPLYVQDRNMAKLLLEHNERYKVLAQELELLESLSWDYDDKEDRKRKDRRREKLRLQVLMASANATPEDRAALAKIGEEEEQNVEGQKKKEQKQR
jgi:hypothetical protein